MESNEILEMVKDISGKARNKNLEPVKYLKFDSEKVPIDGVEIQLNTDGYRLLAEMFGTASNQLLAKRIVAYFYRLRKRMESTKTKASK